jgi:hypothetical protein
VTKPNHFKFAANRSFSFFTEIVTGPPDWIGARDDKEFYDFSVYLLLDPVVIFHAAGVLIPQGPE